MSEITSRWYDRTDEHPVATYPHKLETFQPKFLRTLLYKLLVSNNNRYTQYNHSPVDQGGAVEGFCHPTELRGNYQFETYLVPNYLHLISPTTGVWYGVIICSHTGFSNIYYSYLCIVLSLESVNFYFPSKLVIILLNGKVICIRVCIPEIFSNRYISQNVAKTKRK